MKLVLTILILCSSVLTFGQTVRVMGEDFKPIEGVHIIDYNFNKKIKTDFRGRANLGVFSMVDTVSFSKKGYEVLVMSLPEIIENGNWIYLEKSVEMLPGFVITTARVNREKLDKTPNQSEEISKEKIEEVNAATTSDLLGEAQGVTVQKSQMGGGSPIIRGFEANRVLMVVDGVRMNNAIYRNGHLQNSVTIDNNILQKVEIQYGPGSMLYGSDAIGGVIHFHTKDPELSEGDSAVIVGSAMTRYNSANDEQTAHIDLSFGGEKWGSLSSITLSSFGDLKMGKVRPHGFEDWGLIPYYYRQIDGQDSSFVNPDPNIQVGTGYQQLDALQKIYYKHSDELSFKLNTQLSTSSDVPRFDRLNDLTSTGLKFAKWQYGPQKRFLTSLSAELDKEVGLFSKASFIASYQKVNESRYKRRFGDTLESENLEEVDVYAFNADMVKMFDSTSQFYYGFEGTHNMVNSTARRFDIYSGEVSPEQTRYPDGGGTMSTAAIYTNYVKRFSSFVVNGGLRYTETKLSAGFEDTTFLSLPFAQIVSNNSSLSGSLGGLYQPNKKLKVKLNLSSGFRAPNIDDFGKVFGKDGYVVVPNNAIRPENVYNGEISIQKIFNRAFKDAGNQELELLSLGGTVYYTVLDNAIVRGDHMLNGQDSMLYDGEMHKIQTNMNAETALVKGFGASARLSLTKRLSLKSSVSYTVGEILNNGGNMSHIPPLFGRSSLMYESESWDLEAFVSYNAWKWASEYGIGSTDNLAEATHLGTPSWYTLNVRGAYFFGDQFAITGNVLNILDHHYKVFASGLSAPGRSFTLSLRAYF